MDAAVLEILESHRSRSVHGNGAVWRIEGTSARIELCKLELLGVICRDTQPFVQYEESPLDQPGLEDSVEAGPGVWRLPAGAAAPAVLKWLHLGNWRLYLHAQPLRGIPDLCRSTDLEVEAFVAQSGASLVIDSFHDDVSWVLGLRR